MLCWRGSRRKAVNGPAGGLTPARGKGLIPPEELDHRWTEGSMKLSVTRSYQPQGWLTRHASFASSEAGQPCDGKRRLLG